MTALLEHGRKLLRGEQTPPPIARLLGLVPDAIREGAPTGPDTLRRRSMKVAMPCGSS
jgi:hypothetical protein